MESRLAEMRVALSSGDSLSIRRANERVLAFALKQMAELRLVEHAYPQGIDLYQQSIAFEDVPESHLRLAMAYLQAKRPDDTLAESNKVIYSDPDNSAAWRLIGSAWMQQRDFAKASEALAHALKIQGDVATAYQLATAFLNDKKKDKAELVFKDIVANLGDSADLHLSFGRAYRDADFTSDAEREFRRAIAMDPQLPFAHYYLGLLLLIRNEWFPTPEARTLLQTELKINPKEYVANFLVGMFASGDKKFDESDRYLSVAAQGFPDWPEPPLYEGLNAYGRGDNKTAEELLLKSISLTGADESRGDYQIRRAYIALGRILRESGRAEESEKYFQKSRDLLQAALSSSQQTVAKFISAQGGEVGMGAVAPLLQQKEQQDAGIDPAFIDPTLPLDRVELNQAGLSDQEKQQAGQEEQYLRQILGSSFNDLGTSEARQQQFGPAFENFHQAERWDPNIPGLMRNLGIAAFRVQNYSECARSLKSVMSDAPSDQAVRIMLGVSQYMTGAYPDAAQTLAPLPDAAKDDPAVALPWAGSLAKIGDYKPAAEILSRAEQQPNLPAETLFLIGQTWMQIENYDQAAQTLHRALGLNPQLLRAHFAAGLAALRGGHPANAESDFSAELALNPGDSEAEYNLAYCYLLQSEKEKALPLLHKVLETDPGNADANYQLGKLMMEEGKAGDAIPYLEQAERYGPEKDYVHYQLQAAYRKESRLEDADRELQLYKDIKAKNRGRSASQQEQNP